MIDLHLHSSHSDGTKSPTELVEMASARGLKAISITDHDTVSGTSEAIGAGRRFGVTVIAGVELSVNLGERHFHLLGYDFDWQDRRLLQKLELLQRSRAERNLKILDHLRHRGLELSVAELQEVSAGGQTGRPHIARLMLQRGFVSTMDEAFDTYLKRGACAYEPRFIYSAEAAIALIAEAGGLSSLAHPVNFGYNLEQLPPLLTELKAAGLDGLETYYPTQKGKLRRRLSDLAETFGLIETGGSDYHGDIRPGTTMAGSAGMTIPWRLIEIIQNREGSVRS